MNRITEAHIVWQVGNPEDRFSHNEAHIAKQRKMTIKTTLAVPLVVKVQLQKHPVRKLFCCVFSSLFLILAVQMGIFRIKQSLKRYTRTCELNINCFMY